MRTLNIVTNYHIHSGEINKSSRLRAPTRTNEMNIFMNKNFVPDFHAIDEVIPDHSKLPVNSLLHSEGAANQVEIFDRVFI